MSSTVSAMPRYPLVIFDMDGTLTEELLDFAAIRGEIGVSEGAGILEHILRLQGEERERATVILHRHEMTAAESCVLHAGVVEMLQTLRAGGVRTALLTRNSRACAEVVLGRHGLAFEYVATREQTPHKPHADSILNICRRLGILPEQTLMVGDYLYDVQAAANAGVHSALVCLKPGELPAFAVLATHVVRKLADLPAVVFARRNDT
ncbi:MAG TPA: HAD-IA family hydrolase [Phycisphaerae bacterium]|nr:HAD-IA family hydrolase [Phycisphaerae bacterium]